MPGVTIGEGSIIGAFSFVNSTIPAGVLVYGVPAKVIRPLTEAELADREEPEESL
jgi:acetyltransferase-like isoleucine patch superfamily enzyme